MKYNTNNVYFGVSVYNAYNDGFYFTGVEPFVKQSEDSYKKLKTKNEVILKPFTNDTKEYMTVANLFPISSLMKTDKIPNEISDKVINLYLLKYKLLTSKKSSKISGKTK